MYHTVLIVIIVKPEQRVPSQHSLAEKAKYNIVDLLNAGADR